jgi:flagellin
MFINHNISAMNSQRHLFQTNKVLDKTLERLSSGLRINSGADDASGLAISEKMAAQNAGLSVASQNAQDGQALFKIAEGAMAQVTSMLSRMEELAVRATNGTLTGTDRTAIMDEVKELRDQINQISKSTEYNTLKLLNGSLAVQATISGSDSISILSNPGTMNTGSVNFTLNHLASAAVVQGTQITNVNTLSSGVTSAGVMNINGSDISVNAGDSIGAIVGKINAVNDQTNVVATLSAGKDQIILTTGILDEDAKHITTSNIVNVANSTTPIVGYALQGDTYSINIAGGNVLASIGLTATSATGRNAAGSINGVSMKSVGSSLENVEFGSATYGLKLDTDTHLAGNGVYIQNFTDVGDHIVHKSADGDTASIKVNTENTLKLQIGANYDQAIFAGLDSIASNQLGIGGSTKYISLADIELDTVQNANYSLKTIQKAITDVTENRSKLGAVMNRLDYTISTLAIQRENMTAAQSRIQDADISQEMTTFTKQQIMLQAGTAMLAQANARPQSVLSLLG